MQGQQSGMQAGVNPPTSPKLHTDKFGWTPSQKCNSTFSIRPSESSTRLSSYMAAHKSLHRSDQKPQIMICMEHDEQGLNRRWE